MDRGCRTSVSLCIAAVGGAMFLSVHAFGAPRIQPSRTTGQAESARRVTGPIESIQAVAGDPLASQSEIRLDPKYSIPGGGNYNTPLYNDSNIGPDNKVTVLSVPPGSRIFWNVIIRNWDQDGDGHPKLRNGQMRTNDAGMMSGAGAPLTRCTDQPCANNAACSAAWGETASGIQCNGGFCNYAWVNKSSSRADANTDRLRQDDEACDPFTWDSEVASPLGFIALFSLNPPPCCMTDPGIPVYVWSYCMNVPVNAKGVYTIPYIASETFITDENSVIFASTLVPGILEIQTGSCCYGIAGPTAGCVDGVSQAECDAQPALSLFSPGEACANPPTASGCCECLTASHCSDSDLCTFDDCFDCACYHEPRSWNPATQCCEPATGVICTLSAPNVCTLASCTDEGGHGACVVSDIPAGEPCQGQGDGNPCTYNDVCDGLGRIDSCEGTHVDDALLPCVTDQDCLLATGLPEGLVCDDGACTCLIAEPIPTVSEWGLLILTLLLCTFGKLYFGGSPPVRDAGILR